MVQNIVIPIFLQVLELLDNTLLLETNWFQKAKARLYFDKQKLNLHYLNQLAEVPISNNGIKTLVLYQKDDKYKSEEGDTFGKFEYKESNEAEEIEG
ncbi:4957_t:CDS:1, partial [Gigaspora margarita]